MILKKTIFYLLTLALCFSCKNPKEQSKLPQSSTNDAVKYAEGFQINTFEGYKEIIVDNPWPGATKRFRYAFAPKKDAVPNPEKYDAVIEIPVSRIVVTSTTHIPSLEMLDESQSLVGFPDLDYISSEKTRRLIAEGRVAEVGQNEAINTEVVLDLEPQLIVGFAMDGTNTTFSNLERAGIPVLYNADWTEKSPLGKAEWIKFFGVLFNKISMADSIFRNIENEYVAAKKIAAEAPSRPTVISGAMYKDIWYMPRGDSWAATFIEDAHGEYLWKDSKGTGGLALNVEAVLEKGQNADFWIGPGQFTTRESMRHASKAYTQFKAFQAHRVYSYNMKKGPTGGSIYFELAPNRPDIVLKDYIKILHPWLLPDHSLYFFEKLK